MSELKNHPVYLALNERFNEVNLVEYNGVKLVHIPRTRDRNFHIVCSIGLSDFDMPVPETQTENNNIELFFCLPDYWKPDEIDNPNHSWVWDRIAFLSTYPKERNTWFGNGHTIPFNKEETAISEQYKQAYFLLTKPFEIRTIEPIVSEDKTIHFLAIVPIFKDELDYKLKAGVTRLLRKFVKKGISEKADMFRLCAVRKRRLFF